MPTGFSYLKLQYPQAAGLFQQLRLLSKSADILNLLNSALTKAEV